MATWPANGTEVDTWDAALKAYLDDLLGQDVRTTASPAFVGLGLTGQLTLNRNVSTTGQYAELSTLVVDTSGGDIASGTGIQFKAQTSGGNNITTRIRGIFGVSQGAGAGTIAQAEGVTGGIWNNAAGVVTTGCALRAISPYLSGGGTIGTQYGLYIEAQSGAGITAGWGVYQYSSSDVNQFRGKSKFGAFGTPSEDIHAGDTVRADTAFNLNGTDGVSSVASGVPTAVTVAGGIVTAITKNDWLDQSVKAAASPSFAGITLTGLAQSQDIYPAVDDTHYLGKPDDDSPKAYKGVTLKDTTNGKYYLIQVINGTITATDLTD